jgi:hypothetical protein
MQHQMLMHDSVAWADFWAVALAKLGYETCEVISNIEPLQRAWACENGVAVEEDWPFAVAMAQVKDFKPDVLFVNEYALYSSAFLRRLRFECPSIRLVLGWCGAPYRDPSVFREYDIVLSSVPELVEKFVAQGHRSFRINHAFDPRVLERLAGVEGSESDFTFLGSIATRSGFHLQREKLLVELIDKTPLTIWADVHRTTWRERSGVKVRQLAHSAVQGVRRAGIPDSLINATPGRKLMRWKERPTLPSQIDARLERHVRPPLFGLDMFAQLAQSRVSLNTHIDISAVYASNMRLYEATGVGSCLLTDWRTNLGELFELDTEIVSYTTADECIEKVNYLLAHEEERRMIARLGQKRTLRDHNFDNRAGQLDDLLLEVLASK